MAPMTMGLDKLRLISKRPPCEAFLDEINEELRLQPDQRQFEIRLRNPLEMKVSRISSCSITTKRQIRPAMFLQMNYHVPGTGAVHVLELNPNKMPEGVFTLSQLLIRMFGDDLNEMKVSRVDLNADIELPVDYFRRTLRVPGKRKTTTFGTELSEFTNRGVTGIYIGRSPSLLRVYDKREEMKQARLDVSGLPPIYTRLEWELRQRRSPIHYLLQLPELLDFRPFEKLEIIESAPVYDFHNDTVNSRKKLLFDTLSKDYGLHDAVRILNKGRNFRRDYEGLAFASTSDIKQRLQESYIDGVQRFFANQEADLRIENGHTVAAPAN
jgi:hypothetical protein